VAARGARGQPHLDPLIDVDDFKPYNDNHEHLAGDEVLKRVAAAIQSSCSGPADLPARFGGEEFALVLPGNGAAGARRIGELILAAVEKLQIAHAGAHAGSSTGATLTLTVGAVATVPTASTSLLEFIVRADKALYEAKCLGACRTWAPVARASHIEQIFAIVSRA
jgi:two-component system, chemotaxis family, response regulator WspR